MAYSYFFQGFSVVHFWYICEKFHVKDHNFLFLFIHVYSHMTIFIQNAQIVRSNSVSWPLLVTTVWCHDTVWRHHLYIYNFHYPNKYLTMYLSQAQQWCVPFSWCPLRRLREPKGRDPLKMQPLLSMRLHRPGQPKSLQQVSKLTLLSCKKCLDLIIFWLS